MDRRALTLGGIIYLFILVSFAFFQGELLALILPVLLYLGIGIFTGYGKVKLTVVREISAYRIPEGKVVEIRVIVENQGRDIPVVRVEDPLPEGFEVIEGDHRAVSSLANRESLEIQYRVKPARGSYRLEEIDVEVSDHFGIARQRKFLPVKGRIYVHPSLDKMDRIPLRPRMTNVYSGFIPARAGGPGVEFYGVREYQPGDPIRWINWRASARSRQALFVNQFQQERVADIGLILDTRESSDVLGRGGQSIFAHAVRAAGSLAARFLTDGNRVGMLLYGTSLNWTFPQYGKIQRQRIMDQLAGAQVGSSKAFEKLEHLPTRILPGNAQLVLISPLQQEDVPTLIQLVVEGYALIVISPDPVQFESQRYPGDSRNLDLAVRVAQIERRQVIRKLRQAGISVLDWNTEVPLRSALKVGLSRPLIHPVHSGVRL